MQNKLTKDVTDEISLADFFMRLWSHKLIIIFSCIVGVFYGMYNILNSDKKYTSSAIFKLSDNNSNNMQLGADFGLLTGITGGSGFRNSKTVPNDEVLGREFIVSLDQSINFQDDTFFNNYNPNFKDPTWKATIKNLIGMKKDFINHDESIWQGIKKIYKANVSLSLSNDDALIVSATHTNPQRSAEIANAIMQKILFDQKNRIQNKQDEQLEYLAQTLARAQSDLDESLVKIKNFTVENNSAPLENFAMKTQQLSEFREQLDRASQIHSALVKLSSLINLESTKESDYLQLRKEHPIVDQVEFRRILGQNEIISSWTWPKKSIVNAVLETFAERLKRLNVVVSLSQSEATKAAKMMEDYSSLKRNSSIAEATHTVLIEQVKAQSMLAGFRPDNSRVLEFAAPPIYPSFPNQRNIISLSGLIGSLLGCVLSFILSSFRGVYYSRGTLISDTQAFFNTRSQSLMKLRNIPLSKFEAHKHKISLPALRNIAVEIHRSKNSKVLFTSLNSRLKGNDLAKAVAIYMQADKIKIALINFTTYQQGSKTQNAIKSIGLFSIAENINDISVLHPSNKLGALEFLGRRDFQDQLQQLQSNFDLIFLSADNDDAISLANSLVNSDLVHFTTARIKKTKQKTLKKLNKLAPIQGLLHE